MNSAEVVADVVEGVLEVAGVPEPVSEVISGAFGDLVDWASAELAGGRDPAAQLRALMNTADVAAKALEAAELG